MTSLAEVNAEDIVRLAINVTNTGEGVDDNPVVDGVTRLPDPDTVQEANKQQIVKTANDIVAATTNPKPAPLPTTPSTSTQVTIIGNTTRGDRDVDKTTVQSSSIEASETESVTNRKARTESANLTKNKGISTTTQPLAAALTDVLPVDQIVKGVTDANAAISENADKISNLAISTEKSAAESSAAQDTISGLDVGLTAEAVKLNKERKALETEFMTTEGGPSYRQLHEARSKELAVATAELGRVEADVKKSADTDFLDAPGEYLMNYFFFNEGLNEELRVATGNYDRAVKKMRDVNGIATDAKLVADAVARDTTDTAIALNAEKNLQLAIVAKAEAQAKVNKSSADAATTVINANASQSAALLSATKTFQEKKTVNESQQAATGTTDSTSTSTTVSSTESRRKAESEQQIKSLLSAKTKVSNDALVALVREGMRRDNMEVIGDDPNATPEQKQAEYDQIISQATVKSEAQGAVLRLYELGSRRVPSTAWQNYNLEKSKGEGAFVDPTDKIGMVLGEVRRAIDNDAAEPGAAPLTTDNIQGIYNPKAKAIFDAYHANAEKGVNNPNTAVPLSTMVTFPGIVKEDNKFIRDIITPYVQVKEGEEPVNFVVADVFELGRAAFQDKKITLEEFVDGVDILYSRAINHNNARQGREKKDLPMQTEYNVDFSSTAGARLWNKQVDAAEGVIGIVTNLLPGTSPAESTVSQTNYDVADPAEVRRAFLHFVSGGFVNRTADPLSKPNPNIFVKNLPAGETN